MPDDIFERVLLPVAGVEDAHSTTRAAESYLPETACVLALHVLEGSTKDDEVESRKTLMTVEAVLEDSGVSVETHEVEAKHVVHAIHSTARDLEATSIAFTPRDDAGIHAVFSGDLTSDIVEDTEVPVLVMPE